MLMNDDQIHNAPQPPTEPDLTTNPQTANDLPAGVMPVLPPHPPHRRNVLTYVLAFVLAAAAAGGSYLLLTSSTKTASPQPAAKQSSPVLASAKKQYYLNDAVAGFINYKPEVFKEVTVSKIPEIPSADTGVNAVIVQANIVGFSDSGLYLYDISANKTYRLTDGGGSPRIMSDHYLLYAFDTGSGADKRLGGKLLDLQTGQTQTVFSGAPENVPNTVCCSVSSDGLKAAFVQKNKISVWDINTRKSTDYTATVDPIDPYFSRTSANDYNTEDSYAAPQWLDNTTLVYTNKPAASLVEANKPKQIVDNTLSQLDISTGKSTSIKTDKGGIYDIYIAGGTIYFDQAPLNDNTGVTQIYVVDQGGDGSAARPLGYNTGFLLVSPDGKKVYTFDTMDGPNAYTELDPHANDPNKAPASFDPHIPGVSVTQILPRGFIDNDRMLLAELGTAGTQSHEYIAIYNTKTAKVEQYLKIN